MTQPTGDVMPFRFQEWSELEARLDDRLTAASGLVGVALIEVRPAGGEDAAGLLRHHLVAEDHAVRVGEGRFVIVRSPLVGPAEMEGLGLRIADSFTTSTVHIGVVTGRRGDTAQILLRLVEFGLDDARTAGQPMVAVDVRPTTPES